MASNEKRKAIGWNEVGRRYQRKPEHRWQSVFVLSRQKKKFKEKEGISSTIQPRGIRDRKRRARSPSPRLRCVPFPVPHPGTLSLLPSCSRPPAFHPAFSSHFDAFTCENLIPLCRCSSAALPFFVNTPAVFVRNKHPAGENHSSTPFLSPLPPPPVVGVVLFSRSFHARR